MSMKVMKFIFSCPSQRRLVVLASMMAAVPGLATAQSPMPDAQVEANVLKALAGAPELAAESITTRTVYGTVTLSGSVTSESARTKAETLAANARGVQKVVDELSLGSTTATGSSAPSGPGAGMVLMSDGSYAPAASADLAPATPNAAQRNDPEADAALDQQMERRNQQGTTTGSATDPNAPASQAPPSQTSASAGIAGSPAYPSQPYSRRPLYPPPGYPAYPQYPYGYPQNRPLVGYAQGSNQQPAYGGQEGGLPVTIPAGALLRVRLNRSLRSDQSLPGTTFDGTVVNDVVANGFVAIPRGAAVQGKVLQVRGSGSLSGRGEMAIQLTDVTLAGKTYGLNSDVWLRNGGDKTIETVNKTAGFGAAGAVIGALSGGGVGAAVGGGVGAAVGLGSSAASGNGQVYLPSESIVTFHTAAPAEVATVSEQEMQRLAYGVPAAADQRPVPRTYRVYPGYYPGYYPYPGPYYPYPAYPNY